MNLVAAASQLESEFGGDDSTAAIGWITGDANLHAVPAVDLKFRGLLLSLHGPCGRKEPKHYDECKCLIHSAGSPWP
jgi:hypothetical protein